jgi:hypothetical protein
MPESTGFHSSYALRLRALGQDLEARQVQEFDLRIEGEKFVVRGKGRFPNGKLGSKLLAACWRRLGGKGSSSIEYSRHDLERLESEGVAKRENSHQTPEFHSLSQTLRTVGLYLDHTEFRFVGLRRRGARLAFHFEDVEGARRVEEHSIDAFHKYFLRMYFKRKRYTYAR